MIAKDYAQIIIVIRDIMKTQSNISVIEKTIARKVFTLTGIWKAER